MRASVGPAESLLNMSGNQTICAVIYGATLVLALRCASVLDPHVGSLGRRRFFLGRYGV